MQADGQFIVGETVACIHDEKLCQVTVIAVTDDEVTVHEFNSGRLTTYKPRQMDGYHVAIGHERKIFRPNMIYRADLAATSAGHPPFGLS
jgi:hypothetical protein